MKSKKKKKDKKKNKSAGYLYENRPLSPPSSASGYSAPGRADTSSTPLGTRPFSAIEALTLWGAQHDPDLPRPLSYKPPTFPGSHVPFGRKRFSTGGTYYPTNQQSRNSMSNPHNPFGWTNINSPNNPFGLTNMNSPNNPFGWNNPASPNNFHRHKKW